MDDIKKLAAVINRAERIVAFTGAGFSVPSGIPDFRSAGGIYDKDFDGIPPEVILSHGFFARYPERFYDFYRKKMIYADARPNAAHLLLADLERAGKRVSVVTQNIDGLHTAAGSRRVWELHGSVYRNFCGSCGKTFGLSAVTESEGVPRCDRCGGIIRPDVVLYGEGLDNDVFTGAAKDIEEADAMIVAGTSLAVYPAAGLVTEFAGRDLVLINKSATERDGLATLLINGDVAETAKAVAPLIDCLCP